MIDTQSGRPDQSSPTATFIKIGALIVLVMFCYRIIEPFIGIVLWGLIIAVAMYPLHLKFAARLGDRPKLSATILTIIGLLILLAPVSMLAESTLDSARSVGSELRDGTLTVPPPADKVANWPVIGKSVHSIWTDAANNLQETITAYKPQLTSVGERILRMIGSGALGVLQFVASIIIAGVFLVSAKSGYQKSTALAGALMGNKGKEMTDLSIATIRSVTKGVLGVAIIQALLAAIGFVAMDVPAAGILTLLVLALAIVQIPALLLIGPIIIWVYSVAEPVPATIFAVYMLIVSLSDNVLKPMLLGRGLEVPMLVILLGAIGGAIYAGLIGLFVGAVVLALGYTLMQDWIKDNNPGASDSVA